MHEQQAVIRMVAPKGVRSGSWRGHAFRIREDGSIDVPAEAVPELASHGFKVADEQETEAEARARAEATDRQAKAEAEAKARAEADAAEAAKAAAAGAKGGAK